MYSTCSTVAQQIKSCLFRSFFFIFAALLCCNAMAQENKLDYQLAEGDGIRILVFQNPDLTLETRVSENGSITFPLIGSVKIGQLTIALAEQKIAKALEAGGFLKNPQVNIALLQNIGNQISVLGYVNRPGSFPLPTTNTRVTQMVATAGGTFPGANKIVISGLRNGIRFLKEIDLNTIYLEGKSEDDIIVMGGDTLFIPRAATFYIYGEAQKPGAYALERNMSVAQALALGGGPTLRGTERGLIIKRRNEKGIEKEIRPRMDDPVYPDDIIYVKESLF